MQFRNIIIRIIKMDKDDDFKPNHFCALRYTSFLCVTLYWKSSYSKNPETVTKKVFVDS